MSPARLLRLAGLASVAAGVLLVVTQLLFSLSLVVVDGDPVRHARSPLVGVNGLLTLLAVYLLLLGLVGLYARQSAAGGTLGLLGFLVAFLGTLLLAGVRWWEALAVSYAAEQAPALVAATPTGRLLAGRTMSFGVFALGWVLFGLASLRARVFPRDAAILLIIGGGIGLWMATVPGAGAAGGGGGVDGHEPPGSEARCSFCGKEARRVRHLVASGLSVPAGKFGDLPWICDKCRDLCLEILAETSTA